MKKNKIILLMPGEIGFYLRDKIPNIIAKRKFVQNFFRHLFLRKVTIPLQFMAIAPYLQKAGFEVVIIDGRVENAEDRLKQEIDDQVVYVGITALTGSMIAYGLFCAEIIRRIAPRIPLVWGGVHVTLAAEEALLTSDLVDIVVRGEGEHTAVELAQCLNGTGDFSGIMGVSWKQDDLVKHTGDRDFMDFGSQLPFDYNLLDADKYNTETLLYQSERGCPHRCAFCDVVIVHRRKFRQKNAQQVLNDIKTLYDTFH